MTTTALLPPYPPPDAALIVDGDRAVVRRNYIDGPVVVTARGSDTWLGDALDVQVPATAGASMVVFSAEVNANADSLDPSLQRDTLRAQRIADARLQVG